MNDALVEVDDLRVAYRHDDGWLRVLHGVSFSISRAETFGLAGESGCGKSTVAYQLLGYGRPNSRIEGGRVLFRGRDLLALPRRDLVHLRGNRISLVPQNPTTALSPAMRVGAQISEVLMRHGVSRDRAKALRRTSELFRLVGLPDPERIGGRYPHQLSGGQQQRVCIAMALACEPDLVVLDEPTTGLDVTTQEQILKLLVELRVRIGLAMLYVTHDLSVLAEIADRVGVMYAGRLVEIAPTAALFEQPRHPYSRGLIASIPRVEDSGGRSASPLRGFLRYDNLPPGCPFEPRCDLAEAACVETVQRLEEVAPRHQVACQRWRAISAPGVVAKRTIVSPRAARAQACVLVLEGVTLGYGRSRNRGAWSRLFPSRPAVINDLSLTIERGETFALVGESGSGKSTVARAISGLIAPLAGRIIFQSNLLPGLVRARSRDAKRRIQYIFQNPDASLNPRMRIGRILGRPLELFGDLDRTAVARRVALALDDVRLDGSYALRFPDQLSGGERQRIAIARALVAEPVLLLCDEILSALDVSVQASIMELLLRLRREHELSMLFISHDLAVVRMLADRVGVIYHGQLLETGTVAEIFAPPFHPYTHELLMAVPGQKVGRDRPAPPVSTPPPPGGGGCSYAGRCPWQIGRVCEDTLPPWRTGGGGLQIRCHIPIDELTERAVVSRRVG